jgi:hypothetical protein
MIEKKVYSIEITPCYVHETELGKIQHRIILVTKDKNSHGFLAVDSAPLINFKDGDYLFMSRMVGEGFEQINYIKMDEKDIKKYFPEARKEPKDIFSKFAGTSLFPDK